MAGALGIGSVCVKTTGREAGKKAVVLETVNANTVVIAGPKVRKRKCNIAHLFPTGKAVPVTKGVTQKELKGLID